MNDMSAFRTPPQAEFKAEQELSETGFNAYVPSEYYWQRGPNRSRRFKAPRPAALGYVSSNCKPHDARHVRRRVGSVKDQELTGLKAADAREIDTEPKAIEWKPKDKARIISGPLEGADVVVNEIRGNIALVEGISHGAFRQIGLHRMQLGRPPD